MSSAGASAAHGAEQREKEQLWTWEGVTKTSGTTGLCGGCGGWGPGRRRWTGLDGRELIREVPAREGRWGGRKGRRKAGRQAGRKEGRKEGNSWLFLAAVPRKLTYQENRSPHTPIESRNQKTPQKTRTVKRQRRPTQKKACQYRADVIGATGTGGLSPGSLSGGRGGKYPGQTSTVHFGAAASKDPTHPKHRRGHEPQLDPQTPAKPRGLSRALCFSNLSCEIMFNRLALEAVFHSFVSQLRCVHRTLP